MTVQATAPAVQEFLQASQFAKAGDCAQDAALSDGGANNASNEFKKLLSSMRQMRNGAQGENSADKKNFISAIVKNAVPSGESGILLEIEPPEGGEAPEEQIQEPDLQERAASRFDPDVILGISRETETAGDARLPENEGNTENVESAEEDEKENSSGRKTVADTPEEARKPALPEDIPIIDACAGRIASEATRFVLSKPAKETDAGETKPILNENEPVEYSIPENTPKISADARAKGGVPEGGAIAGENARAVAAGRAEDEPGDVLETSEAHNEKSGKTRPNAEKAAASQGEKTASGREALSAEGISYGKSSIQTEVLTGTGAERASLGPDVRPFSPSPAVYSLRSGNKFGEGIVSVIELMRKDGSPETRIVVEPPALGRIDVSLRSSSNGLEAFFRVENEDLKQMVQLQLDLLKTSLQAQGIHVSGLTVDIRNNEGQKGRDPGAPKKGRGAGRADADDDIAEGTNIARLDLEKGLLHWVA
ncbi:MAG: flagellar hook-length control protein FliK [Synergistaceae bacterium]|jgi:flagellar hook-length control protein FliK|nr:flagellar hook-length control protein FliK [Synergistaceae bacterium]